VPDHVGEAQVHEQAREIHAGRAADGGIAERNPAGGDQRLLERFRRGDVGRARALAHRDADAGGRKLDAAPGGERAVLVQAVHGGDRGDHDVGGLARVKARLQRSHGPEAEVELMAARAGKFVGEPPDCVMHRACAHDLELCHHFPHADADNALRRRIGR